MLERTWHAIMCEPCVNPPRDMDTRLPGVLRVAPASMRASESFQAGLEAHLHTYEEEEELRRPQQKRRKHHPAGAADAASGKLHDTRIR